MGGEKFLLLLLALQLMGSPPRGRGKAVSTDFLLLDFRITPAWAGKRPQAACLVLTSEDHPRVGGEKFRFPDRLPPLQGSPPRGRGKDLEKCYLSSHLRITPAWAGKRILEANKPYMVRDHPRVGGEKITKTSAFPVF